MNALDTLVKQPISRSREFLEECWGELRKVAWPTRAEARAATIAVVAGVVIVALYLGAVDFLLSWAMSRVLN
jgi:preprotein translocase subunit SecE